MARVTMPLLSQDARGSVSGIQFSRNRAGNFGSRKSTSNHKQGTVVTAHRARLKLAHSAWEDLSTALKTNWEEFAPLTQTGRNAFVGAALRNLMIDQPPPTLSPLRAPTRPPITGLRYTRGTDPTWIFALEWDFRAGDGTQVICYLRTPRGFAVPHVRQFAYYDDRAVTSSFIVLPKLQTLERIAIRVIHLEQPTGLVYREWRANIPTNAHYSFPPLLL